MRRARITAASGLLLAAGLLAGCVYYNGMYNAKRLARSAQKAEREGRTFDAGNLWGQVVTRAESVVVRHPESKYVDEALVLQGIALARLRQCPSAISPLGRVALLPAGSDLAEEAALALGRCQMELGSSAAADLAFARVVDSRDPVRREFARLHRARALRLNGRHREALSLLAEMPASAVQEERLLALAGMRRRAEALALLDSIVARSDSAAASDSLLTALGRENPIVASDLLDRLDSRPGVQPAVRARRLLDDALRLAPVDSARAAARIRQAMRSGAGTPSGDQAEIRLLRLGLTRVRDASELAPHAAALQQVITRKSSSAADAGQLHSSVTQVKSAADSSAPGVPRGDLRVFLAAEVARDSLAAPTLAASLFRRVADDWPYSPYAPKALIAGQALAPEWADSARALLVERYADSPYLALLRGEEAAGFEELEDSLRAFAASGVGRPARRPTRETRGDEDDDSDLRPRRRPSPRDSVKTPSRGVLQ
ncbi:MAG: hypothetical protein H0T44_09275 [Gemmatimonadales bacterium]|nr:hypothetical protein [Gemmatimonadales bacterium]MDQ3427860.1 hypothetical protein [Gemmatimonadota bacterium]